MKFRTKLIALQVVLAALVLLILLIDYVAFERMSEALEASVRDEARLCIETLRASVDLGLAANDGSLLRESVARCGVNKDTDLLFVAVYNDIGEHVIHVGDLSDTKPRAMPDGTQSLTHKDDTYFGHAAIDIEGKHLGHVEVAYHTRRLSRARGIARISALIGTGLVIALVLFSLVLTYRLLSPLSEIITFVRRITQGELKSRVSADAKDDIRDLITHLNNMATSLEETTVSKEYVDKILETMSDGLAIVASDGTVRDVNRAFSELVGALPSDLAGLRLSDMLDGDGVLDEIEAQAIMGASERFLRCSDGKRIPVIFTGSAMRDADGDITAFVCVVHDISDRKEAEEKLQRAHDELEARVVHRTRELATVNADLQRFRAILEATTDFVGIAAPHGSVLYVNQAGRALVGLAANADVTEMKISDFHPPESYELLADEGLPTAIRGGSWSGEANLQVGTGPEIPVSMVIVSQKTKEGDVAFVATVSRDIRQERRAAERLEGLNRELESFAYSVSHDLRQPLRTMDGFSKALLEDYGSQLDDTSTHYLNRIRAGATKMGSLIDDLLRLSRVTRGSITRTNIDLAELARSVIEDLRDAEPDRVVDVVIPDSLPAFGDANLLRAVLTNLLGNSWKFTVSKPDARIELGAKKGESSLSFFVKDNGAGFDMAYADKLFAAFQRLHSPDEFEGTGIGLATVQRIIQRHGGRIWAKGEVGEGAEFSFTLS